LLALGLVAPKGAVMAQQTQRLLREQDASLEVLGQGVKRVKALAGDLRTELKDQSVILDNLEDDIEHADSSMKAMRLRMQSLAVQASSSERAQWSLIACLLLIFGVLTLLVLSD
jgi:chromosome segregation ATPase